MAPQDRMGDAVRIVAWSPPANARSQSRNRILWHAHQGRLGSAALGHRIGFRADQWHAFGLVEEQEVMPYLQ